MRVVERVEAGVARAAMARRRAEWRIAGGGEGGGDGEGDGGGGDGDGARSKIGGGDVVLTACSGGGEAVARACLSAATTACAASLNG